MAHRRTLQSVRDEPEQSHGYERERETNEEAFRISEVRLQTALHRAEDNYMQLERTKSQLRAIIDASQEAMLFLSPDGRPLKVNRRFSDFFGLDDTTVLSQSPDQLAALLQRLFVDAVLLERSLTWGNPDQEHIFREQQVQVAPGRREFDFSSLPVRDVDQTYLGRLYVWYDVTHEREVDRLKSEFVSMVSHELRTPLTSIKGYVALLLDGALGEIPADQPECLSIVKYTTCRLAGLAHALPGPRSLAAGRMAPECTAL